MYAQNRCLSRPHYCRFVNPDCVSSLKLCNGYNTHDITVLHPAVNFTISWFQEELTESLNRRWIQPWPRVKIQQRNETKQIFATETDRLEQFGHMDDKVGLLDCFPLNQSYRFFPLSVLFNRIICHGFRPYMPFITAYDQTKNLLWLFAGNLRL